jgi:hypothetical protein
MARGSRRRKRPLKGLLAWVGLAILALVAAKKTVGRFMGHEEAGEEAAPATPPEVGEAQVENVEQGDGVGPEPG